MANFSQSLTANGLSTTTINIPTTDMYNFQGTITVPSGLGTAAQGAGGGTGTGSTVALPAPSQIVATIKQNGSTIFTSSAGALGFQLNAVSCTAADVITIALTSATATDAQNLNSVRLTLAVSEGAL